MRRFDSILIAATLLAACTTAGTSPSPSASIATATSTPIASVVTSASPRVSVGPSSNPTLASLTPTPKPSPSPAPVTGWPTVGRAGITIAGAVDDDGERDGRLRVSIQVSGLAPGEAVSSVPPGTTAPAGSAGVVLRHAENSAAGPSRWARRRGCEGCHSRGCRERRHSRRPDRARRRATSRALSRRFRSAVGDADRAVGEGQDRRPHARTCPHPRLHLAGDHLLASSVRGSFPSPRFHSAPGAPLRSQDGARTGRPGVGLCTLCIGGNQMTAHGISLGNGSHAAR